MHAGHSTAECDPGAGRHLAMENYGNSKIRSNLISIDSKERMTQGNSAAECYRLQSIFLNFPG